MDDEKLVFQWMIRYWKNGGRGVGARLLLADAADGEDAPGWNTVTVIVS